jgi:Arc/MetJ-type ribon-helix-helix transcriptional regulator
MKLVTVHLPDEFLHDLDELVRLKRYPNDLLKEEMWNKSNAF